MLARIADTGLIVALNSDDDDERLWAQSVIKRYPAPFITCEGAIIEAAHLCSPRLIARAVADGTFAIAFELSPQIHIVRALLEKYRDQRMDMTDACIVRMSELFPECIVFSVDHDFDVYRRFGGKKIPVEYPPELS